MPVMSNHTPLFFGPEAAGSFTGQVGLAAGQDSLALLLLFAIAALELGQAQLLGGATYPWQLAGMVGSTAVLGGALYLRMLRPDTYRRRRTAIVAALRLLCAGKLLLSPGLHLFEEPQPQAGLLAAAPHFMLLLAWQSGLLLLGQCAWSLELPPLLATAVQLAGVAAVASRNEATCRSEYMHRPLSRTLLGKIYRFVQPAVAPLEPLLTAAGVGPETPGRQCLCVLSALQFWVALVVPCLLTTRSQLLKYLEWRRERLGQQRQQRREQRRIASSAATSQRAGAAATSQAPLGSGSSKSSPASAGSVGRGLGSGGSSSGRSSLSSDSIDETAGLFASPYELRLAQLLKPPRRGGKPHPDDWQYEAAARLMHDLTFSWLQLALVGIGLMQMWVWHVTLYPATFE